MTEIEFPDSSALWSDARLQLEKIEAARLRRSQRFAQGPTTSRIFFDGQSYLNFSSNNYLDLANDPRVVEAACRATKQFGAGAGGSRLVTGALSVHRELERELARFKACEDALVFSSGYLANLGLLQALGSRADGSHVPVFFDRLSHASMIDALRLSSPKWRSFAHNDPASLKRLLFSPEVLSSPLPRALVLTEGVFSMDGDLAPLPELLELCHEAGALLIVDDAHGTGTVGPGGRGTAAHFGVSAHPSLVQMGTLSKALGSMGGFVAGPETLCRLLENRARTFIFETALAPASAAAALEALRVLEEEPARVEALQENAQLVREALRRMGLDVPDSPAPIIPVILGEEEKTLRVSSSLRSQGILAVAIRPPTVARGTSRLRITVMSSHSRKELQELVQALGQALESEGQFALIL